VQVGRNKYTYKDDKLVNEQGQSVMMGWERPLMKRISELLNFNGGDVLNIGFGMGIVDGYINELSPKSHTIIECHPDVIEYIKETEWESKTTFLFSRWQDQIGKMGMFDSIYLDTWADNRIKYITQAAAIKK
jgi:protein arginine N-methyltransferase 2